MPNDAPPGVPSILQPLHTDEYLPLPRTELQQRAIDSAAEVSVDASQRVGARSLRSYVDSQRGTAAGLLSLNEAAGERYFELPPEAGLDDGAAQAAFAKDGPVIDVQTHWVAQRPTLDVLRENISFVYKIFKPDWWDGIDALSTYNIAEYLKCVFVEAETDLAVITAAPGNEAGEMMLRNDEMAGMRELFDRTAGTGRLLNHTVVRPNIGEAEKMAEWATTYRPVGWKVYTMGLMDDTALHPVAGTGWRLDDEHAGGALLDQARATGVKVICAHKGLSGQVDAGSPEDVGPAAAAYPDLDFLIYHSGYEPGVAEVPYAPEAQDIGVNRLIKSVVGAGLGPGDNVYAELGSTWFLLLSRPEEAAHAIGKLLLHLGEDNIVWGTDSIWYGPTQPALDAFRAFQIPDELCERYGYPKLTPEAKRKILAGNAARVYGVDLEQLAMDVASDDLSWVNEVKAAYGAA